MKRKTTIYLFVALAAAGLLVAFFVLNRNASSGIDKDQKPAFELSAAQLVKAFATDEMKADSMYGGKVLEVHGTLSRIIEDEGTRIWIIGDTTLPLRVSCYLDPRNAEKVSDTNTGSDVRVKGFCNGMLIDIILDNTIVMTNQ